MDEEKPLTGSDVVAEFSKGMEQALQGAVNKVEKDYRKKIPAWSAGTMIACGLITYGVIYIFFPKNQPLSDMLIYHADDKAEVCVVTQIPEDMMPIFKCRAPVPGDLPR